MALGDTCAAPADSARRCGLWPPHASTSDTDLPWRAPGVFKSAAAEVLRRERRLMTTGHITRCVSWPFPRGRPAFGRQLRKTHVRRKWSCQRSAPSRCTSPAWPRLRRRRACRDARWWWPGAATVALPRVGVEAALCSLCHRPGCLISWPGALTWALASLRCRDAGGTGHAVSPGAAVEVLGTHGPQLTRLSTPVAPQARPGAGPPGHAPRQDAGRHHGIDAVH